MPWILDYDDDDDDDYDYDYGFLVVHHPMTSIFFISDCLSAISCYTRAKRVPCWLAEEHEASLG